MAKIYRVIQIILNQIVQKCPTVQSFTNKMYLSAVTVANISKCYLHTRWRQKSTAISMEQNYVTVILCIRKQFHQTALGNCYGLKLPKC